MLNTHNAAKAESKGLEIMKAANNTMTATAVQIRRGTSILLRNSGISRPIVDFAIATGPARSSSQKRMATRAFVGTHQKSSDDHTFKFSLELDRR
jgi:hypothetical protein